MFFNGMLKSNLIKSNAKTLNLRAFSISSVTHSGSLMLD
jgi:hypothetical protein